MQVPEKHYKTISSMRFLTINGNFRSKTNNANLPLAASTFTAPDCDKPIASRILIRLPDYIIYFSKK